ncbi:MAG: hypothetical protein HY820_35050 [Acidobacteria bacterium]|nr:hypothetical protein [Acidobacteriota bacterium]
MPVFKPRNRLVNFRLSEEEFQKLQGGCRVHGARSISDYARSCVLKDLASVVEKKEEYIPQAETGERSVQEITHKVTALETRIDDLLKLVDSLRTSGETLQLSPVDVTQSA